MKNFILFFVMMVSSASVVAATIVGPSTVCISSSVVYYAQRGYGESNYQWSISGGGTITAYGTTAQGDPSITVLWSSSPATATIYLTYYTNAYPSFKSLSVYVDPCYSEALSFNGTDNRVNIPDASGHLNLGTGSFTFEVYFKLSASKPRSTMLSKRTIANGNNSDGFIFGFFGGSPYVQLGGTVNIQPASGSLNLFDGNCHQVAARRVGGTISFFVDGAFVSYGDYTSSKDIGSPGPLWIGWDDAYLSPFPGWIGEVRIWNIALTDAQIQSNLGLNLSPQSGLVAYYDMKNSYNSQVLSDLSGFGSNGFLGGSTSPDSYDPTWLSPSQVTCRVAGNFRNSFQFGSPIEIDSAKDVSLRTNVFPNPAQKFVTIELLEPAKRPTPVLIHNMMGKEAMRLMIETGETRKTIYVGDLPGGIYILKIRTAQITFDKKIIVSKEQ
ncbi:MAG: T9SS type A sorting domain-containing protein [Bacteroidetes bacterium]|nr:T9SS type A sorting domain-containing protein [Bacteroidota bacterium]